MSKPIEGAWPRRRAVHGVDRSPALQTTFSEPWGSVAAPLGISAGEGYHQLRHFYASPMIQAAKRVKVVQERLGHTSAEMTFDVYAHLWPEDDDKTRRAVDAVRGAVRGVGVGSPSL